jgi:UPF0755 protein
LQTKFLEKKFKKLYGILSLSVFVVALFALFSYYLLFCPPPGNTKVQLTIQPGWKISNIASILAEKGIVRSSRVFTGLANYRGIKRFLPGNYNLRQGMTHSEALNVLAKGPIIRQFVVVIPEGFTINQIAKRLSYRTKINGEEFKNLAYNGAHSKDFEQYSFLKDNSTQSLEGYLFPKTYIVTEETTATEFIKMMLNQYVKETSGLSLSSAAQQRGLTSHNLLTIASLIEAEAKIAEERLLISAVIYNRLGKNMKLQIDATIQYALPARKANLNSEDLKVDSPYNTYLHLGLPPGPICNPGHASIQAALNPAAGNYLYYVLTDPSGKHAFTDSYEEFLKQKQNAKRN